MSESLSSVAAPTAHDPQAVRDTMLRIHERRCAVRRALGDCRSAISERLQQAIDETCGIAPDVSGPVKVVLRTAANDVESCFATLLNNRLPPIDPSDSEEDRSILLHRIAELRDEVRIHRSRIARHRSQFDSLADRYRRLLRHQTAARTRFESMAAVLKAPPALTAALHEVMNWEAIGVVGADGAAGGGEMDASATPAAIVLDDNISGLPLFEADEVEGLVADAIAAAHKTFDGRLADLQREFDGYRSGEEARCNAAAAAAVRTVAEERRLSKAVQREYEQHIDELRALLDAADAVATQRLKAARDAKDRHLHEMQTKLEMVNLNQDDLLERFVDLRVEVCDKEVSIADLEKTLVERTAAWRREQLGLKLQVADLTAKLANIESPEVIAARAVAPLLLQLKALDDRAKRVETELDAERHVREALQTRLDDVTAQRDQLAQELHVAHAEVEQSKQSQEMTRGQLRSVVEQLAISNAEAESLRNDCNMATQEAARYRESVRELELAIADLNRQRLERRIAETAAQTDAVPISHVAANTTITGAVVDALEHRAAIEAAYEDAIASATRRLSHDDGAAHRAYASGGASSLFSSLSVAAEPTPASFDGSEAADVHHDMRSRHSSVSKGAHGTVASPASSSRDAVHGATQKSHHHAARASVVSFAGDDIAPPHRPSPPASSPASLQRIDQAGAPGVIVIPRSPTGSTTATGSDAVVVVLPRAVHAPYAPSRHDAGETVGTQTAEDSQRREEYAAIAAAHAAVASGGPGALARLLSAADRERRLGHGAAKSSRSCATQTAAPMASDVHGDLRLLKPSRVVTTATQTVDDSTAGLLEWHPDAVHHHHHHAAAPVRHEEDVAGNATPRINSKGYRPLPPGHCRRVRGINDGTPLPLTSSSAAPSIPLPVKRSAAGLSLVSETFMANHMGMGSSPSASSQLCTPVGAAAAKISPWSRPSSAAPARGSPVPGDVMTPLLGTTPRRPVVPPPPPSLAVSNTEMVMHPPPPVPGSYRQRSAATARR